MTTATPRDQGPTVLLPGLVFLSFLPPLLILLQVRECVELLEPGQFRAKILLGLNFYGFSYSSTGGGHILGGQLVELLARHKGATFRYLHTAYCSLHTAK